MRSLCKLRWGAVIAIFLLIFCKVAVDKEIIIISSSWKLVQFSLDGFTLNVSNDTGNDMGAPEATTSLSNRIRAFFDSVPDRFVLTEEERNTTNWFHQYVQWHNEMRQQFPESLILTDNESPKIAIYYLSDSIYNGGLYDRMANLPEVLQLCHNEQRVLFFKWFHTPTDLEAFLQPHLFNWTLPYHPLYTSNVTNFENHLVNLTYDEEAKKSQQFLSILSNRKVRPIGQKDRTRVLTQNLKPFAVFWQATFQPSSRVQRLMDETMHRYNLIPQQYDAIHLRVRHPAFFGTDNNKTFDTSHTMDVFDSFPVKCLDGALQALRCARWAATKLNLNHSSLNDKHNMTLYFYSDSSRLVDTMVAPNDTINILFETLTSEEQQQQSYKLLESIQETATMEIPSMRVVGRLNTSNIHIEGNASSSSSSSWDNFASSFVDLYIAAQARCLTIGIGRFGMLAALISGTSASSTTCVTRHVNIPPRQKRLWGMHVNSVPYMTECPYPEILKAMDTNTTIF